MARAIILLIFVATLLSLSPVSCDDDLKKQIEDLKVMVYNEIGPLKKYIREELVVDAFKALHSKIQKGISAAIAIKVNATVEKSLETVLESMKTSSAKVEALEKELKTTKNIYSTEFERAQEIMVREMVAVDNKIDALERNYGKVETMNSSLEATLKKVQGLSNALKDLQNVSSPLGTSNSSLAKSTNTSDLMTCHLKKTEMVVQGLLIASPEELVTMSRPASQIQGVSRGRKYGLGFDWNSQKVYWIPSSKDRIMMANLNGADVKKILQVHANELAVDAISGNIYFGNQTSNDVRVCSSGGQNCSVIAIRPGVNDEFVVYSSRRFIYWANETSIVKANKDGSDAKVIIWQGADDLSVDEDSDRLFWANYGYIASTDLDGHDFKVILRNQFGLNSIAVDGSTVYFGGRGLHLVNQNGGDYFTIVEEKYPVCYIKLFGTKTRCHLNPCESHACSFLCVPKQETFVCLCPPGQQLDQDGTTCF